MLGHLQRSVKVLTLPVRLPASLPDESVRKSKSLASDSTGAKDGQDPAPTRRGRVWRVSVAMAPPVVQRKAGGLVTQSAPTAPNGRCALGLTRVGRPIDSIGIATVHVCYSKSPKRWSVPIDIRVGIRVIAWRATATGSFTDQISRSCSLTSVCTW